MKLNFECDKWIIIGDILTVIGCLIIGTVDLRIVIGAVLIILGFLMTFRIRY